MKLSVFTFFIVLSVAASCMAQSNTSYQKESPQAKPATSSEKTQAVTKKDSPSGKPSAMPIHKVPARSVNPATIAQESNTPTGTKPAPVEKKETTIQKTETKKVPAATPMKKEEPAVKPRN